MDNSKAGQSNAKGSQELPAGNVELQNPNGQPRWFILARLIRYEDDAGGTFVPKNQANQYLPLGRDRPAFDLDDPNFNVSFGDLLLYVNRPDQREFQRMRNYEGREKLVPTRMLWLLRYPFSLPAFPLRTEGVPIDIGFALHALGAAQGIGSLGSHEWDDMTPFHIQRKFKESNRPNNVVDLWGKRFAGVADEVIDRPFAIPWGVLVGREDIEAYTEESERKPLNHILNLPMFFRYRYRARTTRTGPPGRELHYINRDLWIAKNPVLPSGHGAVDRTGQEEVDYQADFDATGARPRIPPSGEGGVQTQHHLASVTPLEEAVARTANAKARAEKKAARNPKSVTAKAKAKIAAKAARDAAKEKRKQDRRDKGEASGDEQESEEEKEEVAPPGATEDEKLRIKVNNAVIRLAIFATNNMDLKNFLMAEVDDDDDDDDDHVDDDDHSRDDPDDDHEMKDASDESSSSTDDDNNIRFVLGNG